MALGIFLGAEDGRGAAEAAVTQSHSTQAWRPFSSPARGNRAGPLGQAGPQQGRGCPVGATMNHMPMDSVVG